MKHLKRKGLIIYRSNQRFKGKRVLIDLIKIEKLLCGNVKFTCIRNNNNKYRIESQAIFSNLMKFKRVCSK